MEINAEIYLLNSNSNMPLVHIKLGELRVVETQDLFAGFMTAIHNLTEFAKDEINTFKVSKYDGIISSIIGYAEYPVNIIIITEALKLKKLKKIAKTVSAKFSERYSLEDINNFYGDARLFQPFIDEITQLYKDPYLKKKKFRKEKGLSELKLTRIELGVLKEIENTNKISIPPSRVVIEEGYVTALDLSNLRLKNIPESIEKLSKLKDLDLMNNYIESFPDSFGNLIMLKSLNLNNNRFRELPYPLGYLNNLEQLARNLNPWEGESRKMYNNSLPIIIDFCRRNASIHIFISHAVIDFETYQIKKISEFLDTQKEIYKVYFCEEDLKGNIDEFMDKTIPRCHLLLFIATKKSIFDSEDCKHELELAHNHNIQIIPIKGKNITWGDLTNIGLSRELGLEFEDDDFEKFLTDLYKYIHEYKRKIDLINKEQGKLDKVKFEIFNIFNEFVKTEDYNHFIKENFLKVQDLLREFREGKMLSNAFLKKIL